MSNGTRNSRGVIIMTKKDLNTSKTAICPKGNYVAIDMKLDEQPITIIGVYIEPEQQINNAIKIPSTR